MRFFIFFCVAWLGGVASGLTAAHFQNTHRECNMKMAKPSARDIDAGFDLMSVLMAIDGRFGGPSLIEGPDSLDDLDETFDADEPEHLKALYNHLATLLGRAPGFHNRVLGGMCAVICWHRNEILDPALDHLELHPDLREGLQLLKAKRADFLPSLEREALAAVAETIERAANLLEAINQQWQDMLAQQSEPCRPDILERLTYHAKERDDLTLADCLSYLAKGWYEVHGRTERQMVMQILALLAAAPVAQQEPVCWYDGRKFYGSEEAASADCADMGKLVPLHTTPVAQQAVPAGCKVVPVEPTEVMLTAGGTAAKNAPGSWMDSAQAVYDAMLAAAPEQPAPVPLMTNEQILALVDENQRLRAELKFGSITKEQP